MVAEAIHRGYNYYAICDHSHRLRDGRLAQQAEAIDRLARRVPIRLLKGIEVNIRVNGELDVADEELAGLDWVVASVHSSFDRDPTDRVLAAMENPYVDCIGHLTGRKIGRRAPAAIDARARDREGNRDGHVPRDQLAARPARPHRRPRAGGARGGAEARDRLRRATRPRRSHYVELGVGQARRAWLTKADVVNTHTWEQVEALRKRRPA